MDIEVANRLQKLRKENGYSKEELANKLGISPEEISKWERTEASPDTDNLILLAKLYDMSLDDLLNTDNSISKNTNKIEITDDEGQKIVIDDDEIKFFDENENEVKRSKASKISNAINSIFTLLVVITYLIIGFKYNLWHPGWILFLLIPVVASIFEAFIKKRICDFCYPVLVAAIYLFIGCGYNLWHPYWWLFITIPIFYVSAELIDWYLFETSDEDD